jgi:hypothetical protein
MGSVRWFILDRLNMSTALWKGDFKGQTGMPWESLIEDWSWERKWVSVPSHCLDLKQAHCWMALSLLSIRHLLNLARCRGV